jgi:micrococcal nuclease
MRKLIVLALLVMAALVLSRHGSALHAWATQFGPTGLSPAGTAREVSAAPRPLPSQSQPSPGPTPPVAAAPAQSHSGVRHGASSMVTARVIQVVDGDTIRVRIAGRPETVQYIGVVAAGSAAVEINRRLLAGGQAALELDREERDRSGRLLAYVHAGGVMMNAELVAQGAARASGEWPNARHRDLLRELERQAQLLRLGIWAVVAAARN